MTLQFFSTLKKFFPGPVTLALTSPKSVRDIFLEQLELRGVDPAYANFVRFAVDCEYVSPDTLVTDCHEIAFIPPVSGG